MKLKLTLSITRSSLPKGKLSTEVGGANFSKLVQHILGSAKSTARPPRLGGQSLDPRVSRMYGAYHMGKTTLNELRLFELLHKHVKHGLEQ